MSAETRKENGVLLSLVLPNRILSYAKVLLMFQIASIMTAQKWHSVCFYFMTVITAILP